MHKFIKQHKDFAPGDEAKDLSKDYLQALIDAGIVEEVKPAASIALEETITNTENEGSEYIVKTRSKFLDQKSAERFTNSFIAKSELIQACHEISGGENGFRGGERNWSIWYDHDNNILSTYSGKDFQSSESFNHLRTEAQAQRLIDEHGEALKTYLGIE